MLDLFPVVAPPLVSLISVIIALYGVRKGAKTAIFQSYLSQKAETYSEFLRSLTEYIYQPGQHAKTALTHALYAASLFAPPKAIREMNGAVNIVFADDWQRPGGSKALDEIMDQVIHTLHDDLNPKS